MLSASDSNDVSLKGGHFGLLPFHHCEASTGSPPPTRYRSPCTTPSAPSGPTTLVEYVKPGPSTSSATAAVRILRLLAGESGTVSFFDATCSPSTATETHRMSSSQAS